MAKSYPILINETYYNSACIAGRSLGVDEKTILQRVRSKNFKEYSFTDYRPPSEKICSKCKYLKPLEQFKKQKNKRDGYSVWCKKCWSIYVTKNQNREKANKNNRKYSQTERGRLSKKYIKENRRANETNSIVVLNNDEKLYIKWLHEKVRIMRKYGFDVHLDHIIPVSRGGLHIPDNLQIIPAEDNVKKGNKITPHFELMPNERDKY